MLDAIDHSNGGSAEDSREEPYIAIENGRKKLSGSLLVAAITSVCSSGFLLFGYDQGLPRPTSVSFLSSPD